MKPETVLLHDLLGVEMPMDLVEEDLAAVAESDRVSVDRTRSRIASRSPFFAYLRRGAIERLGAAAESLPRGYGLVVLEGYRPTSRQKASYDRALAAIRAGRPELTLAQAERLTSEYVAPPPLAGHPTGGAVDLTLSLDGVELDMGTAFNAEPGMTGGRTYTDSPLVEAEARARRLVLRRAMEGAGFVNYPSEWWHWSYGDPYWAYVTGGAVRYGAAEETMDIDPSIPPPTPR